MIIKDLQGNSHKLSLANSYQNINKPSKSSFHLEARKLLKQLYPTVQIVEEVPIPIRKGCVYYFDFFLPTLNLFVETQGSQHYKLNSMFHQSNTDFLKQQKRDNDKRLWCEINGFNLAELPYDKIDEWQDILKS
jgi:hypothetical protein